VEPHAQANALLRLVKTDSATSAHRRCVQAGAVSAGGVPHVCAEGVAASLRRDGPRCEDLAPVQLTHLWCLSKVRFLTKIYHPNIDKVRL